MNRFAYAEANPWTFSDPSGHATCFSTTDLCDEQMAIQHQGTAAGRAASGRIGGRLNAYYASARRAHAPSRIYETAPATTAETDWAGADTWGEDRAIAYASAAESSAQAAAVRCTRTRVGMSCQSAQQQADWAATSGGIGDAFGDIWNGLAQTGQCAVNPAQVQCLGPLAGAGTMAIDPVGTGMATGQARGAAIASGDKRAGAHAITSTLIDVASVLPLLGMLRGASVAEAAEVTEGIYEFPDATANGVPYVGNSGNIPLRLIQHVLSGKLKLSDLPNVTKTAVPGGRTAREIAEQLRINEHGGIQNLGNKINVIGPDFQGLMQTFSSLSEYLDYLRFHLP